MRGADRRDGAGPPHAAGVVLAGGVGARMGAGVNKAYLPLAGSRVVSWSLRAFGRVPEVGVLLLVARPDDGDLVEEVVSGLSVEVVHGGGTRQDSELRALRHLAPRIADGEIDVVLLHDAARPLVSPALVSSVLCAAREHGGAIPGLLAEDVVAVDEAGRVVGDQSLDGVIRVQTPQGFRAGPLLDAYERAARQGFLGTDTASCMERFSALPVHWVPGEQRNFKITYPHDLRVAEHLLADGPGPRRPSG